MTDTEKGIVFCKDCIYSYSGIGNSRYTCFNPIYDYEVNTYYEKKYLQGLQSDLNENNDCSGYRVKQ